MTAYSKLKYLPNVGPASGSILNTKLSLSAAFKSGSTTTVFLTSCPLSGSNTSSILVLG